MENQINTIFVDLGDTFRVIRADEAYMTAAKTRIAQLLGVTTDPVAFYRDVIEPLGADLLLRGTGEGIVDSVACL